MNLDTKIDIPIFITCGRHHKSIALRSEGVCLWLSSSLPATFVHLLRHKGIAGLIRSLVSEDRRFPLKELVERNLARRRIRWPALFQSRLVGNAYLAFANLQARLMAGSFEAILERYPHAMALIHNGYLMPHSILAAVAESMGRVRLFTEGGFFPGTVQCDTSGINYDSSLPRDPEFYKNLEIPLKELPLPQEIVVRPSKLPDRGSVRLPDTFCFVPFQVPSDMQILALSPWVPSMLAFYEIIERLSKRFPDEYFVIKEHPSFPLSIKNEIAQNPNIIFANAESTENLIRRSHAVITINSTVGMESLLLGKKVIVLGNAPYSIDGLVMQARNELELGNLFSNLETWEEDKNIKELFLKYVFNVFLIKYNKETSDEELISHYISRSTGIDLHSTYLKSNKDQSIRNEKSITMMSTERHQ
jgi:capsular polysaccharide export protein